MGTRVDEEEENSRTISLPQPQNESLCLTIFRRSLKATLEFKIELMRLYDQDRPRQYFWRSN